MHRVISFAVLSVALLMSAGCGGDPEGDGKAGQVGMVEQANVVCGAKVNAPWRSSPGRYIYYYNSMIRTGSSTSCPAIGQAQPTYTIWTRCKTVGNDGYTWYYIDSYWSTIGTVTGFVRSDLFVAGTPVPPNC